MRTTFFLGLGLLLLCFQSEAQQKQYDFDARQYAVWSVKYCPLGLLEGDQAISLATEYRFSDQLSVQIEGSYIFNFLSLSANRVITQNQGFRIVPELRYYDDDLNRRTHRYMGLQLSYKNVTKELEQWKRLNNYSQVTQVHIHKQNVTGAFIVGIQNTHRRVGFDLNVGIGIKYKKMDGFDDTINFNDADFGNSEYGELLTGIYPQATGTFKFCVRLF